jgi:hypothetical protein
VYGESQNDDDNGKSKNPEKNLLQFHLDNKAQNTATEWLAVLLPIWDVRV